MNAPFLLAGMEENTQSYLLTQEMTDIVARKRAQDMHKDQKGSLVFLLLYRGQITH